MNTTNNGSIMGLLANGLDPIRALWFQFVQYVPQLIAAAIILLVGWVIAMFLGALTAQLVKFSGIDSWLEKSNIHSRLNISKNSRYSLLSGMLGSIMTWVVMLAFIGIAADAINLHQVNTFIGAIFAYIPNVVVAIIILAIGFVGAQYAADFAMTGFGLPLKNKQLISTIIKYAVMVFAVMAALTQLQIVPHLIEILFAGLVLTLSISFGLGGREHANEAIRRLKEQS